jgi:hypothetical protein
LKALTPSGGSDHCSPILSPANWVIMDLAKTSTGSCTTDSATGIKQQLTCDNGLNVYDSPWKLGRYSNPIYSAPSGEKIKINCGTEGSWNLLSNKGHPPAPPQWCCDDGTDACRK